ncbi:hypothetical protein AVEN_230957-1 [Araneus ventricosus]|uniref:Uncharacterized protein n=1 Tax=Araneus ventricosus TaxID=182803 RepID=A0A4Y2A2P0_ARAVE|nr:hypothetical protein AVEN_230957-1 [Araneus ventricosus]
MGHPPRSSKEPSINFLPTFSFPLSRSDLSPVASLSAFEGRGGLVVRSRPICLATQKISFRSPQLKNHWSNPTAGTSPLREKSSCLQRKMPKGVKDPPAEFAEKHRAFSPEIKKNGEEKEYIFFRHYKMHKQQEKGRCLATSQGPHLSCTERLSPPSCREHLGFAQKRLCVCT